VTAAGRVRPVATARPRRTPGRLRSRLLRPALTGLGAVAGTGLLVGALPWLSGDDPARTVLRAREVEREPDPAALDALREQLDLPADPVRGTVSWFGRAVTGDLGTSWVSGQPVAEVVPPALGVSATLAGTAAAVAVVLAVLFASPAVRRAADGRADGGGAAGVLAAALAALPEFVLAVLGVAVVAVGWGLLPTSGFTGTEHLVLPVLALALPAGGLLGRVLAGAVRETAGEAWVRTWRAAGVSRAAVQGAVARRALTVVVPQVLLLLVGLLGAGAVIEAVFDVPGLGRVALAAALAQDLPVVQAAVALLVLLGLAAGGAGVLLHRALLGPAGTDGGLSPELPPPAPGAGRWAAGLLAVLLLVVLAGVLRDPAAQDLGDRLAAPSWAHPLGADALGRDVLARFAAGALPSVGLALLISAVVLVVGVAAGLVGRERAGLADVLNALPAVVVGIAVAAVAGPSLAGAAVAVSLVAWIPLAVHTRILAAEVRASGFHLAARTSGAGRWHLVRHHLLPVVLPPVGRHALLRVPHTALALAGLSFLGLGAGAESPEWGRSLADGVVYLEWAPWLVAVPAAGLVLLGVAAGLVRTGR
jgi:ABC-type dipeptide/oligopeptide/nickel transport system permease component